MKVEKDFFSHSGPGHENQDAVMEACDFGDVHAFAIADGIGGKPGGGVASNIAIKTLEKCLIENPHEPMRQYYEDIKSAMDQVASKNSDLSHMGTTLTTCLVQNSIAKVGHVGDTRIYHLRNQGIVDRTQDQTELQKLRDQGVITKNRAKSYPRKNVLISALKIGTTYDFFTNEFTVEERDRIILLTDGVYNVVPRRLIRDLSIQSSSPAVLAERLRSTVEDVGPNDDYSAICIEVVEL